MSAVFATHEPSVAEFERFRLLLSTFQDGSGMLNLRGKSLPGWRDFERTTAAAFGGVAGENKDVFDVVIADPDRAGVSYGISCKMRNTLDTTSRKGHLTVELSNSSGKFWHRLKAGGFDEANYREHPAEVGQALIELVRSWHEQESSSRRGRIDLERSCYLVLSWSERGSYQLQQLPLALPDPTTLTWAFLSPKRLVGQDADKIVFEWYGSSGGQLKYYPALTQAIWSSAVFSLEPLNIPDEERGIIAKAATYFPRLWQATLD